MLVTQSRKASLMASLRIRVPSVDRHFRGAQLLHPEDVGPLALHIHLAHVDGAIETEPGRHGGRGHAVLAGAGFGDHPRLAHAFDQQPLPHDVVGLVGAGVVEVLAFDVNPAPPKWRVRFSAKVIGVGRQE
jgi:hypothetical protein